MLCGPVASPMSFVGAPVVLAFRMFAFWELAIFTRSASLRSSAVICRGLSSMSRPAVFGSDDFFDELFFVRLAESLWAYASGWNASASARPAALMAYSGRPVAGTEKLCSRPFAVLLRRCRNSRLL